MVIYIHGIGEHPPKELWKREWDIALFGKPMGEQTAAAYWSDLLHGPATVATMRARAVRGQAGDAESADEIDVGAILKEVSVPAAKRKDAAARLERIAAAIAGVEVAGAGLGPRRGAAAKALPLPGFLRRPFAKAFLERFLWPC